MARKKSVKETQGKGRMTNRVSFLPLFCSLAGACLNTLFFPILFPQTPPSLFLQHLPSSHAYYSIVEEKQQHLPKSNECTFRQFNNVMADILRARLDTGE
jgi:hypothetical protein